MSPRATPLKFLYPVWYAVALGLGALSLAWDAATPLMGEVARGASQALALVAAGALAMLAAAGLRRLQRHPQAWRDDGRHPVRRAFMTMLPVALLLVATLAVAQVGPHPLAGAAWCLGSVGQSAATVWLMMPWWRGGGPATQGGGGPPAGGAAPLPAGLPWAGVTPVLFVPVAGHLLAPLAGMPLGHGAWAAAQFGIGLMLWPLMLTLVVVRLAVQGPWPDRLRPAGFLAIAPPAVAGLAVLQMDGPPLPAWMAWGMAVFGLAWAGTLARRIAAQPFGLTHWVAAFALALLAALTLRLAAPGSLLAVLGPALLALATIVTVGLSMATVRGLRDGSLLQPEAAATIAVVS